MSNQISGRVIKLLEPQTGVGKNGAWEKREFVIETKEQYPKKVCFSAWGDKAIEAGTFKIGEEIKVSYNLESREYNGKWFTEVKPWKIERAIERGVDSKQEFPEDTTTTTTVITEDSDLPF